MFKLLRYFSMTSLVAFIIVIVLLGVFYRQIAVNDLIALGENQNVAMAKAFSNSLWPQFVPFVTSVGGLNGDELRAHPDTARLHEAILAQMTDLSVVKVKVYNLDGLTVFSTEASQIGEDKSTNPGYLSARSGQVASLLTHRDTFNAFEETLEDRDVFESYVPIQPGGPGGSIEGVLEVYSDITPLLQRIERTQRNVIIGVTSILLLLYGILFLIVRHADKIMQDQHKERKRIEEALEVANDELETRVASRTQRLEIVASLGEHLTSILEFDRLLVELVNQIKEKFGYYQANIYLHDERRERLVVAEGTGEAGAEMKRTGYSIPLNTPTSLVARAGRRGEIVIADNVREAPDWLPNPLLPNTYSEMAVPIILDERVVGVLDVQDDEISGLDEGDANLLRSLANQVAVAIRNARLFEQAETALGEARAVQERYLEQTWRQTEIRSQQGQYRYSHPDAPALDETALVEARQIALTQNQVSIVTLNGEDSRPVSNQDESNEADTVVRPAQGNPKSVVAPITLQDKTIGALQLHPAVDNQSWTEDDLAVIEAVIDQLAQSAENLRLFEETRERASREQTIREITDKLRAAPNVDVLLETAARELGQRLGVRHTVLELGIEAELRPDRNENGQSNNGEEAA